MTYDLRKEPWIPFARRSGRVEWGPPVLLVDRLDDDPVVAVASPRPDFDGALLEFLIGLLTVALVPENEDEWAKRWHRPPSKDELQQVLDVLPRAFDLDGEGPRFLQDYSVADFADVETKPVERLLIDAPGEQGLRFNTDLFVKRARVVRMGEPAVAMALLTLQTFAPAGGQGNRTSLRGGGPLTALVDPRANSGDGDGSAKSLWRVLWANVETTEQWRARTATMPPEAPALLFPWLAPTRTSEPLTGATTSPLDAHPLQCYFGMPRRIRLDFTEETGACDVTGMPTNRFARSFRMVNYGVNYEGWHHPLSPHYRQKTSGEWLPRHGQSSGIGWRDWVGFTLVAPEAATREPARCVAAFQRRGPTVGVRRARVLAFGYDMDNMKARDWTHASVPAFLIANENVAARLRAAAEGMTEAADLVAGLAMSAIAHALYGRKASDVSGDLGEVKSAVWAATEDAFYGAVAVIAESSSQEKFSNTASKRFLARLEYTALRVFDERTGTDADPNHLRRVVRARFDLSGLLRGHGPLGRRLWNALGLPTTEGNVARPSRQRRKAHKETE